MKKEIKVCRDLVIREHLVKDDNELIRKAKQRTGDQESMVMRDGTLPLYHQPLMENATFTPVRILDQEHLITTTTKDQGTRGIRIRNLV